MARAVHDSVSIRKVFSVADAHCRSMADTVQRKMRHKVINLRAPLSRLYA